MKKREGVERHEIGPTATLTVKTDGPAIVLVVID
ncbi:MAG: BC1881 family protein [Clostridiales bacterium]|nr:BC1881 family protein [Clostridiales bacterium]